MLAALASFPPTIVTLMGRHTIADGEGKLTDILTAYIDPAELEQDVPTPPPPSQASDDDDATRGYRARPGRSGGSIRQHEVHVRQTHDGDGSNGMQGARPKKLRGELLRRCSN